MKKPIQGNARSHNQGRDHSNFFDPLHPRIFFVQKLPQTCYKNFSKTKK